MIRYVFGLGAVAAWRPRSSEWHVSIDRMKECRIVWVRTPVIALGICTGPREWREAAFLAVFIMNLAVVGWSLWRVLS